MKNTPISGIYEIVNMKTGRRYIGSTARLSIRFLQHRSKLRKGTHDNPSLQNAWNKYGEESFLYRTLELCEKDQLLIVEQRWLDLIYSDGTRHYNIAPFATSGAKGRAPSTETRGKQSVAVKAAYTPEKRAAHSAILKARCTPEYRQAMSEKHKAAWASLSDERKDEIKAARLAGANKPRAKAKQIAGVRALYQDPEFVALQRSRSTEAARRPETRAKHAENLARHRKECWADPEYVAKMRAAAKASAGSEEGRKRRSDAIKARWADPVKAEKLRAAIKAGLAAKKSSVILKS